MSKEGIDKMIVVLNVLEVFLSKSKYLAGDNVTIADLSLLGTISTLAVSCFYSVFKTLKCQLFQLCCFF